MTFEFASLQESLDRRAVYARVLGVVYEVRAPVVLYANDVVKVQLVSTIPTGRASGSSSATGDGGDLA